MNFRPGLIFFRHYPPGRKNKATYRKKGSKSGTGRNFIIMYEKNRYFFIETGALLFITFGLALLTHLEYKIYEETSTVSFYLEMNMLLIWMGFKFIIYAVFYWLVIKKLVLSNRHLLVFLSLPLLIILSNYYDKYVMEWSIIHFDFFPAYLKKNTLKYHEVMSRTIISYKLSHDFLAITGLAYLVRALEQSRTIKGLKEQQLLTELKYLKNRLNPHFFFNTLNNIYALAIENSGRTPEMVSGLSRLMRYMLYESDKEWVYLQKETDIMREYVLLEKIRYGEKFEISFDVQGIQPADKIAPLLFLPYIENAFKHGLEDATGDGFVAVVFCKTEDQLIFEIKNSISLREETVKEQGIGLVTARKRLDLLFGNNYTMEVREDRIYEVQIIINSAI